MQNTKRRDTILRKALEDALMVLGELGKVRVLSELKRQEAYREDAEYLERGPVAEGMQSLFGQDFAEVIIQRVIIRTDELYSAGTSA